jgi:MFS transporter, NNP family, nitrate/nitrite transporter
MMFSPVLPFIEDEFHISHAKASSIFIFQSLGYGISIFFSGLFSGTLGYKRSIMVSLIVSAFMFFLVPFTMFFNMLYVLSFILGVSAGIYIPAAIPLIIAYYEEKIWGKSIAIHDSSASIGVLGAPIIALFLLEFFQWRGIFSVLGGVFILAALIFYFLFDELKVEKANRAELHNFFRKKALWTMGIIWIFAASNSLGIYSVTPLYLTKELHLDIGYANTIFGISRLGGCAAAIGSGFLVSRFSIQKIMASILVISGIFTVFVALAGVRFIGLALFLQAIFIYGFFPAGLIALSRMFEMNIRSIAIGFISGFGVIVGWGITPYLLGLSGDLVSFKFGILMLGLGTIMASRLVFLLKELRPAVRKEKAVP